MLQGARIEAEKAAECAREELEKARRQAQEGLSEEQAAHEAMLARLTAQQEKAQVRPRLASQIGASCA